LVKAKEELRILLVDDNKSMRKMLSSVLRKNGFQHLFEAFDGSHALRILAEQEVDLALVDWNMPKITGAELLTEIRNSPTTKDLPVIFVTSEGTQYWRTKAFELGVTGYVTKPFSAEGILEEIEKIFESFPL